jgi:chromosome segregation ATPase
LLNTLQEQKYEKGNRILNQEDELLNMQIKEEKALSLIHELKEKLKLVFEDKKDLETEFLILKKNYIEMSNELDQEKLKVENLGLELINLTNAKKEIEKELQLITKHHNSESFRIKHLKDKLEAKCLKETELNNVILNLRNDINILRNQQRTLELDNEKLKMEAEGRRLELEKGFLGVCKDREAQIRDLNRDLENKYSCQRNEKMKYESQKNDLMNKIKMLQRKIEELEALNMQLRKENKGFKQESIQLQFKYDECRKIYRAKLFDFLQNEDNQEKYLNAREDLLHNYAEKEVDLLQQMTQLQKDKDDLVEQVELVTKYARECKYIAEDTRLPGSVIPDILSRPFPRNTKEYKLRNYTYDTKGTLPKKTGIKFQKENYLQSK